MKSTPPENTGSFRRAGCVFLSAGGATGSCLPRKRSARWASGGGWRSWTWGAAPDPFPCRVVGKSGRVLASDTSPAMLRALRKKSKEIGLKNLHLKKSADPEFLFPDGCADMAMLGFVLHETARTDRFLSETMRTLRPGGRAVILERHPVLTEYGPPLWARLDAGETKRMVRKAGLVVERSWSFDDDTYFDVARRPSGKKAAGPFSGAAEAIERRVPGGKKA